MVRILIWPELQRLLYGFQEYPFERVAHYAPNLIIFYLNLILRSAKRLGILS